MVRKKGRPELRPACTVDAQLCGGRRNGAQRGKASTHSGAPRSEWRLTEGKILFFPGWLVVRANSLLEEHTSKQKESQFPESCNLATSFEVARKTGVLASETRIFPQNGAGKRADLEASPTTKEQRCGAPCFLRAHRTCSAHLKH